MIKDIFVSDDDYVSPDAKANAFKAWANLHRIAIKLYQLADEISVLDTDTRDQLNVIADKCANAFELSAMPKFPKF